MLLAVSTEPDRHADDFCSILQLAPGIREDCQNGECAKFASHFQHCQEKVEAGKGWHGEDCVDEMFHMMHCVDVSPLPLTYSSCLYLRDCAMRRLC